MKRPVVWEYGDEKTRINYLNEKRSLIPWTSSLLLLLLDYSHDHRVKVSPFLSGFATIDEFKTMNSMGLTDLMSAMSMSHPLHRPRYSDQTWVNQRSLGDPVLNKVIER